VLSSSPCTFEVLIPTLHIEINKNSHIHLTTYSKYPFLPPCTGAVIILVDMPKTLPYQDSIAAFANVTDLDTTYNLMTFSLLTSGRM
jgi:hypothetical protein